MTLDLGQGDETYVVGSFEQSAAGIDTVTPGSPLGRAILGAEVGYDGELLAASGCDDRRLHPLDGQSASAERLTADRVGA